MAIEFIKEFLHLFQVERTERRPGATAKTNIGYISRRKDGSIHFCGCEISELEEVLSKMKELQEAK